MQNIVWEKIGTVLNTLHCENVKRESYIRLPEAEEALRLKKEAEREIEDMLGIVTTDQKTCIENYIDSLNHQAFFVISG